MKIAIIGSGIAGSSLAYYLRDMDVEVTIYESRDVVGGRMRDVTFEGTPIEIGAGFFHTANQNIMELTSALDLEKIELHSDTFGLWDGNKMRYKTHKNSIFSKLILLRHFGFNLFKLQGVVNFVKDKVRNFYERDEVFYSVPEMIKMLGFDEIYLDNFETSLSKMGVGSKILTELAMPATQYIYHQCGKREMNGFAGYVSLIASDGDPIYFLKEGNKSLCQALVRESRYTLCLNEKVNEIKPSGERFVVNLNNVNINYDMVVIATPLEIADIKIDIDDNKILTRRLYYPYTKTIVKGIINPNYFGTDNVPEMIFTTEEKIQLMFGMSKKKSDDDGDVWVISSENEIKKEILDKMFQKILNIENHTVSYTYPNLFPLKFDSFPPLEIQKNLFYISSVDSLSPTMEGSLIVSRNIAKLIKKKIRM